MSFDAEAETSPHIMLFLHSFDPGGVERTALRLAGAWSNEGYRTTVVMGRRGGALAGEAPEGPHYRFAPPFHWAAKMESLWMTPLLLREIGRAPPDVLFCPGNTYAIVAVLVRLVLGRRCPPIVCKISNTLERRDFGPVMTGLYRLWLWLQGRLIDRFVALAEPTRSEIERGMAVAASRVHVVHDPHVIDATPPERRRRFGGRLYLGIGRLVFQKDFGLLIRAFALAAGPKDRLAILGDGPERLALEEVAAESGRSAQIVFEGHTEDADGWLDRADVFVLSSRYEGLPAVVVEALARGTKVVATDCSASMGWLLAGGRLGLITPPGDVEALAAAMRDVPARQTDEALRRERVAGFSLSGSALGYMAIFGDLLAAAPSRHSATSTAPVVIKATPAHSRTDRRSPRKATANTATSTTLSLSTGATREAGPSWRAR